MTPVGDVVNEGDLRNAIRQEMDRSFVEYATRFQQSGSNNAFSPGDMKAAAYSTVPTGWLACDGSVVSQATYPELFAAIGASWNTGGEGAGNFRLPPSAGRTLVGVGAGAGLTARVLGAVFGTETHTLSAAESGVPAHGHGVSDPGHAHGPGNGGSAIVTDGSSDGTANVTVGSNAFHRTPVTGTTTTGLTVNNSAAAAAANGHNNVQPSTAVSYFIKT